MIGTGVVAPIVTGIWWSPPLIWFLGLVIVLPILHTLAKPLPEDDGDEEPSDPALDALRERYARGEIGEEEFERRLDRLLETEDAETKEGSGDVRERVRREIELLRE